MNVLIVGGGTVGGYLAELLLAAGHRVTLVELRPAHIDRLRAILKTGSVVEGDGADPAVLEACGARSVQIVAAVTGADETNLVVTSLSHFEFGVPRTLARVNDPRNAWLYTREMGVDITLNQADIVAHLIARELTTEP
ncbi:MAG: hypothetical protein RLZZ387_2755 [Chloroflexota bacterium]|jgi:trk system potassium uptake protein TrkA